MNHLIYWVQLPFMYLFKYFLSSLDKEINFSKTKTKPKDKFHKYKQHVFHHTYSPQEYCPIKATTKLSNKWQGVLKGVKKIYNQKVNKPNMQFHTLDIAYEYSNSKKKKIKYKQTAGHCAYNKEQRNKKIQTVKGGRR